jgi:hypothetical protein
MQVTENQPISPSKDLVGRPVEVRVLFRAPLFNNQRVMKTWGIKFSRLTFLGVPNVCPILRKARSRVEANPCTPVSIL